MSNALGAGAPGAGDQSGGFMQWLAGLPAAAQASIMRSMNYANPANAAPSGQIQPLPQGGNGPASSSFVLGNKPPSQPLNNAASLTANGNPLTNPTPVPQALQGGGPPVQSPTGTPNPTPWFTPSNTPYAPNPAAGAPIPPPRPVAQPAVARGGGKGVSPRMRAQAPAAAASSPFIPVAAQNQDWSGGALSRYPLGGRQGTALDLSKLFSRS